MTREEKVRIGYSWKSRVVDCNNVVTTDWMLNGFYESEHSRDSEYYDHEDCNDNMRLLGKEHYELVKCKVKETTILEEV